MPELGANTPTGEMLGALTLSTAISTHVGADTFKIDKPAGAKVLVIKSQSGTWRVRTGDRVSAGMPSAAADAADVTDGTSSWVIMQGETLVLNAPTTLTLKGFNAGDIVHYYFL